MKSSDMNDTKKHIFSPLHVSLSANLSVEIQKKFLARDLFIYSRATVHKTKAHN